MNLIDDLQVGAKCDGFYATKGAVSGDIEN